MLYCIYRRSLQCVFINLIFKRFRVFLILWLNSAIVFAFASSNWTWKKNNYIKTESLTNASHSKTSARNNRQRKKKEETRSERGSRRARTEGRNNRESKHNDIPKWRGKCCSAHFINQTVNFTPEANPRSHLKQTQIWSCSPHFSSLSPPGYTDQGPMSVSLLFICV